MSISATKGSPHVSLMQRSPGAQGGQCWTTSTIHPCGTHFLGLGADPAMGKPLPNTMYRAPLFTTNTGQPCVTEVTQLQHSTHTFTHPQQGLCLGQAPDHTMLKEGIGGV